MKCNWYEWNVLIIPLYGNIFIIAWAIKHISWTLKMSIKVTHSMAAASAMLHIWREFGVLMIDLDLHYLNLNRLQKHTCMQVPPPPTHTHKNQFMHSCTHACMHYQTWHSMHYWPYLIWFDTAYLSPCTCTARAQIIYIRSLWYVLTIL